MRIQLFDFRLAVREKVGGNFRGKFHLAFLKETVIFPHHKGAISVRAVIIFLALKDGFTATGTFADNGLFLFEKGLVLVREERICFHKLPCHILDTAHKAVGVGVSFCDLR